MAFDSKQHAASQPSSIVLERSSIFLVFIIFPQSATMQKNRQDNKVRH